MNSNQIGFLADLCELLTEYNITDIYVEAGRVNFKSNGQILSFREYIDNRFEAVAAGDSSVLGVEFGGDD